MSIRKPTLACRATRAGIQAKWCVLSDATSFPTATRSASREDPHWLYTVRFDGRELWGADSDPTVRVAIEAWEPYLEPV